MEFLVAGQRVQLGTVNFYDRRRRWASSIIPAALQVLGAKSVHEIVGSMHAK